MCCSPIFLIPEPPSKRFLILSESVTEGGHRIHADFARRVFDGH